MYRGLLQGSFAARFDHVLAWLVASAWFALIHFRPVEYPGLFVFGLVRRLPASSTGRLGMSIADPHRVQRHRPRCWPSVTADRTLRLADQFVALVSDSTETTRDARWRGP